MRRVAWVVGLLMLELAVWTPRISHASEGRLPIFGYLETAKILPQSSPIKAKLDTGADHSSIHAADIAHSKRNGTLWVRFVIKSDDGRTLKLDRQVIRTAHIKRPGGKAQARPVVMMAICIGNLSHEVQVNLVDRSVLNYDLLIGRSFMSGHLLVDPSQQFTTEPTCE